MIYESRYWKEPLLETAKKLRNSAPGAYNDEDALGLLEKA